MARKSMKQTAKEIVIPLNEKSGYCGWCAGRKFSLSIVKSQLLRHCKECDQVVNMDSMKIVREGKEERAYKN